MARERTGSVQAFCPKEKRRKKGKGKDEKRKGKGMIKEEGNNIFLVYFYVLFDFIFVSCLGVFASWVKKKGG